MGPAMSSGSDFVKLLRDPNVEFERSWVFLLLQ